MKKVSKLLAIAALAFVAAGSAFAQKVGENLLFTSNSVVPAAKPGYASVQKKGKAPSGKDAIIVSAETNGNDVAYRGRIDFKEPAQIRGATKLIVEWEPLDADIKSAGGMQIIFSTFTLNPNDNKAHRAGTLDYAKRGEDKKEIFMKNAKEGFQGTKAEFNLTADYQAWTDTSWDGSTKKLTGIEFYHSCGQADKVSASQFKGVAITSIRFE